MSSLSLTRWFEQQVVTRELGARRNLFFIVTAQCLSLISLIVAFWYFAAIMHSWVVSGEPANTSLMVWLLVALSGHWLLRGLAVMMTLHAKSRLNHYLEQRLLHWFVTQQHALARQHSGFYWQTLWLTHIPAISNWQYDYRVQQSVAVIMPLVVLAVIFSVNVVIGVSLLITLPVVPLFMIIVGKGAASLQRKHFVALERLGGLFTDRLSALPMLASFRAHAHQLALLENASETLNARTMKVVGVAFLSSSVLDFFSTLAVALIAVFIGFSLLGEISLGPAIEFSEGLWILLSVPLLLSEMKRLGQYYHQKAEAQSARDALQPLTDSHSDGPVSAQTDEFTGACFEHFSIVNPALEAESLSIFPGDHIRLTGASGAGKTVLLEALAGQRQASHRLTANLVWLNQQPVLLPSSVRDNLCLGKTIEDERLYEVLEQVELEHWLVLLADGLDTLLTETPPLSGGEAQRLCLARILLRDADVWLLDEPTAHVSDAQHQHLSQLIHHCAKGKTVIWASHKSLPDDWFEHRWCIRGEKVSVS